MSDYCYSPKQQQQHPKRRLKFDMSSKIQIVPDNRQGQLNTAFLATVPGVLKIAEIVSFYHYKTFYYYPYNIVMKEIPYPRFKIFSVHTVSG